MISRLSDGRDVAEESNTELSFPIPNDALFTQGTEGWRLRSELRDSALLRTWETDVSLLGGAPLSPLISVPLTQAIDLAQLLRRQRSKSLLDDAIYLVCITGDCTGEMIPLDFGDEPVSYGLFSEAQLPRGERGLS